MAVGTDTITVYKGDDVTLPFTDTEGVDITGWTLQFTVKLGSTTYIQKNATITDGPSFQYQVSLTDTDDTDDLVISSYYRYKVKRTDDGSENIRADGSFVVKESI